MHSHLYSSSLPNFSTSINALCILMYIPYCLKINYGSGIYFNFSSRPLNETSNYMKPAFII